MKSNETRAIKNPEYMQLTAIITHLYQDQDRDAVTDYRLKSLNS